MKTITISALILGVALCTPVVVYASDGVKSIPKHHAHHQFAYLHPVAYLPLTPKAVALVPAPVVVPAARETDGLSRNHEDCNEGCIDN
jgi:hypothetical protein